MTEEFKKTFSDLTTSEKRNQISNELIIIAELIKSKEEELKIPSNLNIKNYDNKTGDVLTESEVLDFLYEDIYNIQRELITIFSIK